MSCVDRTWFEELCVYVRRIKICYSVLICRFILDIYYTCLCDRSVCVTIVILLFDERQLFECGVWVYFNHCTIFELLGQPTSAQVRRHLCVRVCVSLPSSCVVRASVMPSEHWLHRQSRSETVFLWAFVPHLFRILLFRTLGLFFVLWFFVHRSILIIVEIISLPYSEQLVLFIYC
jgi:hypothetical protein